MNQICITVPVPPSINSLYATFRGRRILSKKGKDFKTGIASLASFEKSNQNWVYSIGNKLIMEITIHWPDNRRRDPDNIIKIIQDSFTGVLYSDDRYILPQIMDFDVDKENPRVNIRIYPK